MNLKSITFKDLQKMYGEQYQDLNDIKSDYCIFFEDTLKEAICQLLDENTCVVNNILEGSFYKYLQSHIAKFENISYVADDYSKLELIYSGFIEAYNKVKNHVQDIQELYQEAFNQPTCMEQDLIVIDYF